MVERRATCSSRFRPLHLPRPSNVKRPFLCDHIHPDNALSPGHLRSKSDAMFVKLGPIGHHDPLVPPENHQLENAAIEYFIAQIIRNIRRPQFLHLGLTCHGQHGIGLPLQPRRHFGVIIPWPQAAATSQLFPTQKTIQKFQIRSCPTSHIALDVLTMAA